MAHCIQGIIAKSEFLSSRLPPNWPRASRLSQGFSIVPVTAEMIDEVPHDSDDSTVDGFTYLAPSWQKALAVLSAGGEVVYIETDYFGGMGSQGAAAYRDQRLIFGPKSGGSGPISEALETIGVSKGQAYDAFEAIGLVRFRRMDDLKPEE